MDPLLGRKVPVLSRSQPVQSNRTTRPDPTLYLSPKLAMEGRLQEFAATLMSLGASAVGWAVAEEPSAASVGESKAYVVEVSDVTAKVDEPAVMRTTLKAREGYRILKHYNNRVIQLSSFDDGVAFEQRMVPATLDEDTLVFEVPLHATKAGKHPINGVMRVGYIHGTDEMAMVSLRLIANVTGTE